MQHEEQLCSVVVVLVVVEVFVVVDASRVVLTGSAKSEQIVADVCVQSRLSLSVRTLRQKLK